MLPLRVLHAAVVTTLLLYGSFLWSSASRQPAVQSAPKVKARLLLQEYNGDQLRFGSPSEVPASSHKCTKGQDIDVVCYFTNVFLWQGSLLYVSTETGLRLPEVAMDFRTASGQFWLEPKVVPPEAVVEARKSARGLIDWTSPGDEVYVWSGTMYNYGHFIGEHLPTIHNAICKYLGRCVASNTTGMRIVINRKRAPYMPSYVTEAMQCLAETQMINMQADDVKDLLIPARRLLVGIGPNCRAADLCQRKRRSKSKPALTPMQYRRYRDHMAQCLGFDAAAAAPVIPKMKFLIVDRHFSSGRHMLNVAQVLEQMRLRYGSIADVEVVYMENTTVVHQARLWNSASLVIHIHGASLGNYAFLPHKAAAIHISLAGRGRAGQGDAFPTDFESDLTGVTDISAILLHVPFIPYGQLRIREFEKDPLWNNLTREQKATILEQGSCRVLGGHHPASKGCAMRWLLKGHDMAVPIPELLAAVDRAVGLLYEKQGMAAPQL